MACHDVTLPWLNGIFWLHKDLSDLNAEFEPFSDARGVLEQVSCDGHIYNMKILEQVPYDGLIKIITGAILTYLSGR